MVADGWLHLGLNPVSQKQVDSFLEAEMTHHWHRTQSLNHHWKVTHSDDWTLVDSETGEFLARIFDQGDADLLGSWRWWVAPFYLIDNVGSAQNGQEAKRRAEERLAAQDGS